MGTKLADHYSLYHLAFGFLAGLVVFPPTTPYKKSKALWNQEIGRSFLFANLFHLFMEAIENEKNPEGEVIESNINHVGDIIVFATGWYAAYLSSIQVSNRWVYWGLVVLLLLGATEGIFRELFPDSEGPWWSGSNKEENMW